ncbi:MAG: sugar ABC transporter substrate-binding protein [Candidatus Humimicrobiaceae bacterium]
MKKIKNILLLVSVLLISIFFVAGCGAEAIMGTTTAAAGETTAAAETTEAAGELGTIAFMWGGFDAPFVAPHAKSFTEVATAAGAKVVNFDAKWDAATQSTLIDDAIAMKVDLIAICPVDPKAIIPALKKAFDAGVPVMVFNTRIEKEGDPYIIGYSGVGAYEQGLVAAELVFESVKGEGKLAIVEGVAGFSACVDYQKAVDDYFAKNNAKIETLGKQPTGWAVAEATKVAEDFLTRFPKIDVIYSEDDYLAGGVKVAMEEAGKKPGDIKLVGIGGTGDALQMIKDGWMYGTVLQSPISEAKFEAERAIEFLKTKKNLDPFYKYIDNPKITKENVGDFKSEF